MGRAHYDLQAWQLSMQLVTEIYNVTKHFPQDEINGLTAQMRRAAVLVPSNIAEGAARNNKKDFLRYLASARGSLSELETQLLIALELGYVKKSLKVFGLIEKTSKLITALYKTVLISTRTQAKSVKEPTLITHYP